MLFMMYEITSASISRKILSKSFCEVQALNFSPSSLLIWNDTWYADEPLFDNGNLLYFQEFGEDAATAINELLGLYGYDDDNKRSELSVKFHRNSCKKIANISQKLLESKRQSRNVSESESLRSRINDYSSISSDKDSSSRENSKSPLAMKIAEKDGEFHCATLNRFEISNDKQPHIISQLRAM